MRFGGSTSETAYALVSYKDSWLLRSSHTQERANHFFLHAQLIVGIAIVVLPACDPRGIARVPVWAWSPC